MDINHDLLLSEHEFSRAELGLGCISLYSVDTLHELCDFVEVDAEFDPLARLVDLT